MTPSKVLALIIAGALLLTLPMIGSKLFENLDASEIMVVQSPFSGELTWHTSPGTKWQGMGTVTKYQRRHQFWFSYDSGPENSKDESIKIRFNDGAHAAISGSLSWEMPLDPEHLTKIHMAYGHEKAIEDQLIETNLEKSVYMAGPIMSSAESYAARRNDLLGLIDDQFQRGVYQTRSRDERITDPITNQPKTVKIVDPVVGPDGQILREEESPLIGMGIKAFNLSINEVKYDPSVEAQIQKQQESIMAVQTAIAAAKTAEQEVLTVEANGKASAAKAEWAQRELMATETTKAEQEKMVAVTAAQKELEVAQLKTQAAEQQKLAEILLGEGEATRRKLVMDADGALEKKLTTYMEVNSYYAQAIGAYGGSWVPAIVMGGEGAQNGQAGSNGANELISLLTAKTAKDLKLEMDFSAKAGTLPEIKRPEMPKFQLKKNEGPAWGTSYLLPTAPKTPVPTLKK